MAMFEPIRINKSTKVQSLAYLPVFTQPTKSKRPTGKKPMGTRPYFKSTDENS